jgi:hypothetical protein
MESMKYCAVENTARAVEELFDIIECEGEDLLKRLGPYEKPFYPRLIRLCRMLVELHEEEGYQTLVDSWNEDQEVQSAYELYEIIDSMEED